MANPKLCLEKYIDCQAILKSNVYEYYYSNLHLRHLILSMPLCKPIQNWTKKSSRPLVWFERSQK